MFDGLAAAVDALEVPLDRDALVELYGLRDRLDAKLLVAVGEFDRAELWDLDGDTSMANWLRHQAGRETTTASREAGRARKLGALPVLRQAFLDGTLSGGHVEVILANVPVRHLELFATHEAGLIDALAGLDTDELRAAMVDWRAKADAVADDDAPAERDSEVYLSTTIDGRGELRGSLDADLTALVDAAFRVADGKDFALTPAERRADAFETIVRHFLDHQQTHTGGRHRPHVNVALTYQEFLEGIGGTYPDTGGIPSPAELGATLCDCATHRVLVEGRSAILAYGRARRLVPADLFQALMARDCGCRFPGCTRPAAQTDAHHVVFWRNGGPTAILNPTSR
jgi:hypothetical protein